MNKVFFLLFFIFLFGCNSETKKSVEQVNSESNKMDSLPTRELVEYKSEPERKLYLNGIYEYDYPDDTEDMNENQYIAFNKNGDSVQGWYFGTSDEFDEAREGYLPSYFVAEIANITTKGDSVSFTISTGYNQGYSTRFPIGIIDTANLNEQYEKWFAKGENQTIHYSGKLDGLNLYIEKFGETRTYRKTRNYFHPGIDNYDSTKCQTVPLLTISKNIDDLDEQMMFDFLSTFSVICEANVEFEEWSNELLFKTLSNNPELVLKVLANNSDKIDTTSIFSELGSPLHDFISIDSITAKIESLNVDEQIKTSVLKRLKSIR